MSFDRHLVCKTCGKLVGYTSDPYFVAIVCEDCHDKESERSSPYHSADWFRPNRCVR